MRQKTRRYTDHHIQDELLKLLVQNHLLPIASAINEAGYFAPQDDEVTDSSNHEQVVVCIRREDAQFQAHEDFIGLHHVADITTETIVGVLKDTVLGLRLSAHMWCTMLRRIE